MKEMGLDSRNLNYFHLVRVRWKEAFSSKSFQVQFVITMLYGIFLVIFLNYYFNFIQCRTGTVLKDPILALFHPINLSVPIFSVIYCCALIGLFNLMMLPGHMLRALEAMAITYTLRIFTMYLVKLDPPAGMVALSDPFILRFAYEGNLITKDLFFSGHTTSMLMLVLATKNKVLKYLFTAGLLAVIYMLLWERVHYTIDIVGAVVFSLAVWRFTRLWWPAGSLDLKTDRTGKLE
jgi:hypothetical protein